MYHLIFIVKIKKIMAICLIGKNLTTLVLSKVLINKGLNDLYYKNNKLSKNLSKPPPEQLVYQMKVLIF